MHIEDYFSADFWLDAVINGIDSAKLYRWREQYPIEYDIALFTYLDWPNALAREYRMFGDAADAEVVAQIFQFFESHAEYIGKVSEPEGLE